MSQPDHRLDELVKMLTSNNLEDILLVAKNIERQKHNPIAVRLINDQWENIPLPNENSEGLELTAYVSKNGDVYITNEPDFGSDLILLNEAQARELVRAHVRRFGLKGEPLDD